MLCDNLEGWDAEGGGREVQQGGDICVPVADSCGCMAETNTILESNYPLIKKKKKVCLRLVESDCSSCSKVDIYHL